MDGARFMKPVLELDVGYTAKIATPFAVIGVITRAEKVTRLQYLPTGAASLLPIDTLSREVSQQIKAFVADCQFKFDLPCEVLGTDFQRRVWAQISSIALGSVLSYGEIAKRIPSAARAVGNCCGANRLSLIIPCHRVVGACGIGGFMHTRSEGDALRIKRWLLRHEGALQ